LKTQGKLTWDYSVLGLASLAGAPNKRSFAQ
jgi:hypothetical protein